MSHDAMFALLNVAGVTTLVGERIRPKFLPQGKARPALTYHLVSRVRHSAMGSDTGLVTSRFQTNAWSYDIDEALAVRAAVRAACQRQRGTFGGIIVEDVFIDMEQDFDEADAEVPSGGQGEVQLTLDVLIWHREN